MTDQTINANLNTVGINDIYVLGTSGFASEIDWLISDISSYGGSSTGFQVKGFIAQDDDPLLSGSFCSLPVISESRFKQIIDDTNLQVAVALGVGSPEIKKKIATNFHRPGLSFPALVHPSSIFDKRAGRIEIGEGVAICAGNILTTNIKIGRFVTINLDCTIGHNVTVGEFSTISPGAHISGNVSIGSMVYIGTGASIIQGISIGEGSTIGAGAVVNRDVAPGITVVGVPAKPMAKK